MTCQRGSADMPGVGPLWRLLAPAVAIPAWFEHIRLHSPYTRSRAHHNFVKHPTQHGVSCFVVPSGCHSVSSPFHKRSCNAFVGQLHLECFGLSAVTVRICMFVSSRTNLHTCTLPLAGSRMLAAAITVSLRQARHVHARFECPGTLPSHSSLIWE